MADNVIAAAPVAQVGVLAKCWYAVRSFFVGLAAFFVIKLAFMLPLNLMATPKNVELIKGIGALLFLFSIYLAVKFTKKLNMGGTAQSRRNKRALTIISGLIAMMVSNAAILLGQMR